MNKKSSWKKKPRRVLLLLHPRAVNAAAGAVDGVVGRIKVRPRADANLRRRKKRAATAQMTKPKMTDRRRPLTSRMRNHVRVRNPVADGAVADAGAGDAAARKRMRPTKLASMPMVC